MNILSVKDNQKKPGQWSAHYFVMRHICLKGHTKAFFEFDESFVVISQVWFWWAFFSDPIFVYLGIKLRPNYQKKNEKIIYVLIDDVRRENIKLQRSHFNYILIKYYRNRYLKKNHKYFCFTKQLFEEYLSSKNYTVFFCNIILYTIIYLFYNRHQLILDKDNT